MTPPIGDDGEDDELGAIVDAAFADGVAAVVAIGGSLVVAVGGGERGGAL